MKQGTVSALIGCHSIIHGLVVLTAWYKLYGSWPKLWQMVCIFLHDIGHIGLDYLDDYEQKKRINKKTAKDMQHSDLMQVAGGKFKRRMKKMYLFLNL